MRVTLVNPVKPAASLLTALELAEKNIKSGVKGQLTEDQMQEAIALSEFLPPHTEPIILEYLDQDDKSSKSPRRYTLIPERVKAEMSGCGDKLFVAKTRTTFYSEDYDPTTVRCATVAYLWMPNAIYHGHGNEDGDINNGKTFEDYVVCGGGPAYYVMGDEIWYVEPDKDPDAGVKGWEIPPGKLHGVFSEDPNNPALAVLRFHRQGLALRSDTKNPKGWGWPRDEKAYNYTSRVILGMIEQANGNKPSYELPKPLRASV